MPIIKTWIAILGIFLTSSLLAEDVQEYQVKYDLTSPEVIVSDYLRINSEQKQIKIGAAILFKNENKRAKDLKYEVLLARLDGSPIKYEVDDIGSYTKLIGFGEDNVVLPKGIQHYMLEAKTEELAATDIENPKMFIVERSVNGSGWNMPIQKISATVILPEHVSNKLLNHHAYILKDGKKDLTSTQSVVYHNRGKLEINYHATRALAEGEEFYIVARYPKPRDLTQTQEVQPETVTVDGKKITLGKTLRPEEAMTDNAGVVTAGGKIKIHGKEIVVGKSVRVDQESKNSDQPADVKIGKSIQLDQINQKQDKNEVTSPQGQKVEVGKTIRVE